MKKQTSTRNKSGAASDRNGARTNGSSAKATAPRSTEGLKKLFEHQLMDLYYVETQLTKHLPKMAEAAVNEELATAFTDHLEETKEQLERLTTVFGLIGRPVKGQKCPAIDGILEEAKDLMEEFEGDAALDAALACAAQKVEHYEITSYGSLCAFAEQLGMDEACDEIEAILDQEKAADKKLSRLAEAVLNIEADEEAHTPAATKANGKKRASSSDDDSDEEDEDEDADAEGDEADADTDEETADASTEKADAAATSSAKTQRAPAL